MFNYYHLVVVMVVYSYVDNIDTGRILCSIVISVLADDVVYMDKALEPTWDLRD